MEVAGPSSFSAKVYEGMIVGSQRREGDISSNACKARKLTNIRAATADVAECLNATVRMSLEEALAFIADDELLEVTPLNRRLRKAELTALACTFSSALPLQDQDEPKCEGS